MQAKKIKIASLIVTYNRVGEAKAQMDIIREAWQPMFESIDLYHEFNGKKSWYPKKYREDFLGYHKSMDHLTGANHLLNQGIKHILESGKKYDFIIVTSADAWFYDPGKLKRVILRCFKKRIHIATSIWGVMGFSTEFFIITPDLAKKIFPISLTRILREYHLLKWANHRIAIFESIFTLKIMRFLKNPNKIYLIPGRKTVWLKNRFYSRNFYASHHDLNQRKKDILPKIHQTLGAKIEQMPSLNSFLS